MLSLLFLVVDFVVVIVVAFVVGVVVDFVVGVVVIDDKYNSTSWQSWSWLKVSRCVSVPSVDSLPACLTSPLRASRRVVMSMQGRARLGNSNSTISTAS